MHKQNLPIYGSGACKWRFVVRSSWFAVSRHVDPESFIEDKLQTTPRWLEPIECVLADLLILDNLDF
ncbi:MAG TPA: hypothetical protein VEK15_27275, partial [Vicinamibacteria bacterium]|nr:hypothetical protein [Vicinamibacteria bacterium]